MVGESTSLSKGSPKEHPMATSHAAVSAFVLITVPAQKSGDIVSMLMEKYPEFVVEAAAVYGEADVIAKVETPSVEALHDLVMNNIQDLPNVKVTRTFIVIPQLHEVR
jgi:DNA-binding Lrp family transcriptional regulator